jgi:aconitate decarboxylase
MTTPITSIRDGRSASHGADVAPDSAGQPTDPAGPTGRLSCWLANTTLDDVPATVRERAKHLILDGIACALVGAQLPVSRTGVNAVTALDGAGDAALIGWGTRTTSPTSAAMLNSSFIQGFELDDYHPIAPLHSNALVLTSVPLCNRTSPNGGSA